MRYLNSSTISETELTPEIFQPLFLETFSMVASVRFDFNDPVSLNISEPFSYQIVAISYHAKEQPKIIDPNGRFFLWFVATNDLQTCADPNGIGES
jgi:hypothetical protein